MHAFLDKGYLCYKNPKLPNTIDIYVPADAQDELSDFDFFYNNIALDQLNDFYYLDKNRRGELFVQWRRELDNEVYQTLYDDFTKGIRSGNSGCDDAEPFCTGNGLYDFPAGVNAGTPCSTTPCPDPYYCSGVTHQGQDACLYTAPNPAFYFLRIDQPGSLNIEMYSTPAVDIDFDCWGPFTDMNTACSQLSCSNMVDCSYSTAATEHCHINNAQTGQYYVLLITNYSNSTCNISFQNVATGSGAATTDCTLLPPMVANGGPYCVGETISLTANTTVNASYQWTGPNGFTSTQQNLTIPNCTMANAGTYICYISYGGQSNFATTQVVVYPEPVADFTFNDICVGNTATFTSTSTTNPTGSGAAYQITSYAWDFGDGQTGTGSTATHTYAQAGSYQVTLTVTTGNGRCSDQITKIIQVIPALNVDIVVDGNTQICDGESVTMHAVFDSVDLHFYASGDILCTDGTVVNPGDWPVAGKTPMGIVFYVDNTNSHGWAVSLTQSANLQWCTSTLSLIGTANATWRDAIRDLNGKPKTQTIQNTGPQATYPAAWVPNIGQGWYLPSAGQLNVLFGALPAVNHGLSVVNGTQIVDTAGATVANGNIHFWSSTEKNANRAYALEIQDGQIGSVAKDVTASGNKQYVVRAIIDF